MWGERCTKNEIEGEPRQTQVEGNFNIFLIFLMPQGWGLNSTTSYQDITKSQMGVLTPTYWRLLHLLTPLSHICIQTHPHTYFMFTHYTLTLPYTYTGNKYTCKSQLLVTKIPKPNVKALKKERSWKRRKPKQP